MGRDRAAYMREYRAAKKTAHERYDEAKPLIGHLKSRISELEAAQRGEAHEHRFTERWYFMDGPDTLMSLRCEDCGQHDGPATKLDPTANTILRLPPRTGPAYSTRPFTPVPKKR